MDWTDANFQPAPCMPCCGATPTVCACALLIPVFDTPYADYATAAAVVSDPLQVSGCVAFCTGGPAFASFSATHDATSLTAVTGASPSGTGGYGVYASITALSGETLTITATVGTGTPTIFAIIYDCNGTIIEDQSGGVASPFVSITMPADGVYYIVLAIASDSASATFTAVITSSGTLSINPVVALWDDSGTTRQLEACPKMLIPPLTESTGDWYADLTAAGNAITNQTSNCVGYCEAFDTFTATNGGTSLSLDAASPSSVTGLSTLDLWGSVNAEVGDVITLACTFGAQLGISSTSVVELYDYTGTLIDTQNNIAPFGPQSPTFNFPANAYTGRYIVHIHLEQNTVAGAVTSSPSVITSSGTMTVNPITALYDCSLTCPCRLDCS